MGFRSRTKKMVKPFIDYRYWMSWDEHKTTWENLSELVKDTFLPPVLPEREESFEAAVARMELSERALQTRMRQCLGFASFFFFAGVCSLIYTAYLLFSKEFAVSFLGIGVTSLFFAYAFRYHFWYFQIKNRRLGCTFKDWWQSKIKG